MKVFKIDIKNILGLESLEIKPGSWTEISGQNGSGKTSCLDAIRAALGAGHDATLLRQGAAEGEVVLVLEDGTEIKKRITEEKSDVSVVHPQFGKISKPASYIKKLADALSLNPVQFLTAAKKDRVDQLLQAIPMQVTADQLGFVPTIALQGVDLEKHALEAIAAIGKQIYDIRTGVNRSERDKLGMVRQMEESLPADAPDGDWSESLTALSDKMRELTGETSERVNKAKRAATDQISIAKEEHLKHAAAIKEELEAAIESLRQVATARIHKSESDRDERIRTIETDRDAYLDNLKADYDPQHKELTESIAQAKAMIEQHAKAEKTREMIAQVKSEAEVLSAESAKLTHAMGRLEILKASLLEQLPIEGLSVQDGDIYIGGIPFDRVNTAKRVQMAIEIAKLRAGSLGLIACDGLELLDSKTFDAFKKAAAKSNLQFVVSRVTDGPLHIESEKGAA